MNSKYLAFDIEIAQLLPEDETDWKAHRPLGITCAAAASSDGGIWNWYAREPHGRFSDRMSKGMCRYMVWDLLSLVNDKGYTILTWNGLGFDFDILGEESGMRDMCRDLALSHIDLMFHFFCTKGYPLGLDADSKGMGLLGKPEAMDGGKAPILWAQEEYHKVLDCVTRDVKTTLALTLLVEEKGHFEWTSRSGNRNEWLCDKWLTVKEALKIPEPDTSWMTDPWPRSKFYGWLENE